MSMKFRKATLKDFESLKEIVSEMYKFEMKLDRYIEKDYIKRALAKKIEKNLRAKKVAYFVADDNGTIVGYSGCEIEKAWDIMKLKKVGHLYHLYVRPDYRKRGVAEGLCRAAFSWFKQKNLHWYKILIYVNNPYVKNYYEKYGFKPYVLEYRKIVK